MKGKYIGQRKIRESTKTEEKTPGGNDIYLIEFADGEKEWFSELMLKNIISDKSCDLTELQVKRIHPVIEVILAFLRDYGLSISDLPYLSAKLNQSLDENTKAAVLHLWEPYQSRLKELDQVNLISVDRVLRSKRKTLNDVLGGEGNPTAK